MEEKEILYLIEKLESKTISPDELKKLQNLFHTSDSKILLRLMREKFNEISASSETLPDYKNQDKVRERLIKQLYIDRHPRKRANLYYWAIGLAAICLIAGFLFLTKDRPSNLQEAEWITVSTKHGERKKVTLSDGSSILLNGNTTLSYPKQIQEYLRLVKLNGEAFFEVAKNHNKPFLIVSKDFTTQVVGTSFNLDTDIGKDIEVNTGTVHVFALQQQKAMQVVEGTAHTGKSIIDDLEKTSLTKVILQHGEKAHLNDDHTWATSSYHYKNWMDNELVYLNEPISQVVRKAYRNYGDSIAIHPDLTSTKITITFKSKQKEQVLNTLAELCNGKLIKNQTTQIWEITK